MPTITPPPASATASAAAPVVAAGAVAAPTDQGAKGLPLPYPDIIANPSRPGEPRLSHMHRKALGLR